MESLIPSSQEEIRAAISFQRKKIQNHKRVIFYSEANGKTDRSARRELTELEDRLAVLYGLLDLEL